MKYRICPPGRETGHLILSAENMRQTDQEAINHYGVPGIVLMEHAGRQVAREVQEYVAPTGRVLILCGKGNNGGDGFVAARHLADWGVSVTVFATLKSGQSSGDARLAAQAAYAAGVSIQWQGTWSPKDLQGLGPGDVIVDALLGTGTTGRLRPREAAIVEKINMSEARRVAVDLPSGICADTGQILGVAVKADSTITFHVSQPGHWCFPGSEHCGQILIVDIGLPNRAMPKNDPSATLISPRFLDPIFEKRPRQTHKGSYGHVGCIGGSMGQTGAILMAADAALAAGAGLATIGTSSAVLHALTSTAYEVMAQDFFQLQAQELRNALGPFDALIVGPGWKAEEGSPDCLDIILATDEQPQVIDAGALNLMAHLGGDWPHHSARVITPHPGEAARLLGCTVAEVQGDRFGAARRLASMSSAICVLKGAHTLVCSPSGDIWVCTAGTPGMSTAGMGDVLAGVIGALMARKISPKEASIAAVLWHALAGESLVKTRGENGLRARDLIESLAEVERCYQDWT